MLQTFKQWLIYYVHDETFLGKTLNVVFEWPRGILQTIINSSDGSSAGDLFVVFSLFSVFLLVPMIPIFIYYGFRLHQIREGKISDQAYHANAKKYFGQASAVLLVNVILFLSYIELSDFTRLFMQPQPQANPTKSDVKQALYVPPKNELEHVYIAEFNLLFSYLTESQFPISCLVNANSESLFFTLKPERSIILHLKPSYPENYYSVPEQKIYLEIFADPLKDNEIPQM